MTSTASKPLRADARRNRERVLEAARDCFARDGLEAQIDDIAACAGVGVGTVYRHFETKDALVCALAQDHFARQNEIAHRALAIEDPWGAFSTMIRDGAELAANRALAQIMADRPAVMADAAFAADAEFGFFTAIERLISRAKDAGVLRYDFELEDIPSIMCSLGSLRISKGAYANWRRVLEFVLDGLRAPGSGQLPEIVERLPRSRSA
jgi:AcrR family transcriptional regulator